MSVETEGVMKLLESELTRDKYVKCKIIMTMEEYNMLIEKFDKIAQFILSSDVVLTGEMKRKEN
jgi:hypothetical protein